MSSVALDRPASPSASVWAFALRLAALACVYVFLAQIALTWFNLDANVCLFWPASGVSLGVMLLGGPRYGWGVVLGTLLEALLSGHSVPASLALAVGTGSEALLAYTLIHRMQRRPPTDASLNTLFQVTLLSGAVAAGLSTLVGTGLLLVLGWVTPAQFWVSALHWWMGDMLGIALITPMVLVWHRGWPRHLRASQWLEAVAVLALSWLAGQVIFLGWLSIELSLLSRQGYWMFFFVTWAAIRLGSRGVVLLLCATAVQAFLGAQAGVGFFSDDLVLRRPSNLWFYLMALTLVGLSLSTYLAQLRRFAQELRVAAIAFEAQTGMAVLDAQRRVLRINRAFTHITGFDALDLIGQPIRALASPTGQEVTNRESVWLTARRPGGAQMDLMHRHKTDAPFPAFVTITAVLDARQQITHYVTTVTNTAQARRQEQQRLAHEAAHRDALVREVHHRIKNNLQGITGLLRQWAHGHPETAALINQAISQVQGIALVHGLQGQDDPSAIRFDPLLRAIANEIGNLWRTHIDVDVPPACARFALVEREAVPMALVLNELMLNAVKHGGLRPNATRVALQASLQPARISVTIRNPGQLGPPAPTNQSTHAGLELVRALLPRKGVQWTLEQQGPDVVTLLHIGPPIIQFTAKDIHDDLTTSPPAAGG